MKKLTQKEFTQFKNECLKLQKEFGLLDWELYFDFKPLEDRFAQVKMNEESKVTVITLSSELEDDNYKDRQVLNSARHEMIHILLNCISELANKRYVTEEQLISAEEGLVHKLLKLIWK